MSKMEKRLGRMKQRYDQNAHIQAILKHGQTRWGGCRMNFPRSSINLSRGIKGARQNYIYTAERDNNK